MRRWTSSSGAPSIEFSPALLEEVRAEVVRALHGMGKGGLEVGGILLGTFEGENYRIDTWRPVRCDYSRGSSFLLSDRDVATLSCQIEAVQADPVFEGRRVLGWFISHTRGGLEPRVDESQMHTRLFDNPGSLLLTVQPSRFGDAQVGIHIFEPGDPPSLRPLDPLLPLLPAPGLRNSPADNRTGVQPRTVLPWDPRVDPPSRRSIFAAKWLKWVVSAAGVAFMVLAVLAVRGDKQVAQGVQASAGPAHVEPTGPPRALLSLHLQKTEDAIEVSWDASSPPVSGATAGVLSVLDQGELFTRSLTADDLRLGRIEYTRSIGEIRVRLSVNGKDGEFVEEAHYTPHRLPALPGRSSE
jgi:hypothetical protein